jgi:predicted peptidase
MTKILFALFISIITLNTCLSQDKQFGKVVFEENERTEETKDEIMKIKSINNSIFDSSTFVSSKHDELKYRMFEPSQQQSGEVYPLVIVYHGSAGIGTDNESHLMLFQKLFVSPDIQKEYPAYILAPQFSTRSSNYSMDTTRNVLVSTSGPCLISLFELVDSLKLNLNIDSNRIYVVGYSMGGSTVINSLSERPDLFAAGISISGVPQLNKIKELAGIPIWLIHGTSDTVNSIESDEQLYAEISDNIRFWVLKGKAHDNIVTQHILGDVLPKLLFNQSKKQSH